MPGACPLVLHIFSGILMMGTSIFAAIEWIGYEHDWPNSFCIMLFVVVMFVIATFAPFFKMQGASGFFQCWSHPGWRPLLMMSIGFFYFPNSWKEHAWKAWQWACPRAFAIGVIFMGLVEGIYGLIMCCH